MKFNFFKEKDLDRRKRESNILNNKKRSDKVINARLNFIILIIVVIFSIFVARLGYIQINQNKEYERKLEEFTSKHQTILPPRGEIYDANGKILAQSVKSLTISYYPSKNISNEKEWELAKKFVNEIGVNKISITDREIKDMYILYNSQIKRNELNNLVPKEKLNLYYNGKLSEDELYNIKLKNIKISNISDYMKKVFQVKMKMDASPDNEFKTIMTDCSDEQFAYLTEHKNEFDGFVTTFGWKRKYYDSKNLGTLIGKVSTKEQGIPKEESEYYQALGYAMNDVVGVTGVEKEYEELLSGTKSVYEIKYNNENHAYLSEVKKGKNGYNLKLTINSEFQKKVNEIIKDYMKQSGKGARKYWKSTYFVAVDVKTGGIISLNGIKKNDKGELYSDPTSAYIDADRVGSVVKMATLYMGLNEKAIKPGEVINDAPMHFLGANVMKSFNNYGPINDKEAIEVSSNVYMWNIVLRLNNQSYKEGMQLNLNYDTVEKMRRYYNMFGLGIKTGVDLPNEQVGTIGSSKESIKPLHFAIGQYDTYTALQLAQYATTVANDGERLQLHILDKVEEVNNDSTVYTFKKNILSTLKNENYIKRGQEGMRACALGTHCEGMQDNLTNTEAAAKSGTAENELYIKGKMINTVNTAMVGYAPYDNPEIAFVCFTPNSNNLTDGYLMPNVAGQISGKCLNEYFSNFKK